jgi:hypothetical protein
VRSPIVEVRYPWFSLNPTQISQLTRITDSAQDLTQRAQNQEQELEFADSSGPLFFMYRKMVEEEDNKMAERWQKDADGILIFVGTSIFVSIPLHTSI